MVTRFLMVVLAALSVLSAKAGARDLSLQDAINLEYASDPQLSPDGSMMVFRRMSGDEGALWLMDQRGQGAAQLGAGWSARWSPQGDDIAFVNVVDGKQEIFLTAAVSGATPRRLTNDDRNHSNLAWSPNGRFIAFTATMADDRDPWPIALPPAPAGRDWGPPPQIIDTLQYRTPSGSYRSGFQHIFLVDVESGAVRQLTRGYWDVGARFSGVSFAGGIEWAPDGSRIYFDGWMDESTIEGAISSAIFSVNVASGEVRQISQEPGFWRAPRASPDGQHIAFTGHRRSNAAFASQELRLADAEGGSEQILLADAPDRIFSMEWTPESDALVVGVNENGATSLRRFSLGGGVRRLGVGDHRFFLASVGSRLALGSVTSPSRVSDIASVDLRTGRLRVLTALNQSLRDVRLGEIESFWVSGPDGAAVQAWLMKPPGFDPRRRYPLILDIHGGPDAMGGFEFDFRHHDFATRGYMVLYMNPRGSTGYGAAFANGIEGGFPNNLDAGDLEAGVDAAIGRGFVDEDRVYVMGCSAGGALAAMLTARSDRFAAAVVMCPVTNWISAAGTTDATSWAYTRFRRPFWEDPQTWLAHSPLMRAGDIDVPILIAVGARDGRTPPSQASELYAALRTRGVETRMLVFPNEGHGPWRGSVGNLMRLQLYTDDWFNAHARRR